MLCGTQFLLVLAVTIVAIALPDIRDSLDFTPEDLQRVISAYTLAFGGLLVAGGRVADLAGPRRVFAAGVVGFGAAWLACAFAPTGRRCIRLGARRRARRGVRLAGRLPRQRAALRRGRRHHPACPPRAAPRAALVGAVAAFAAFALLERRSAEPMLPPWALRRPAFGTATAVAVANTAVTTSAMFLAILYQQETLGRGPLEAGLWCAPFNLAVIAGSLLAPRAGWPPRAAMSGGLAAMAAGALVLLAHSPVALLPAFLLMGAGLGVAAVASTASGMAPLDDTEQGIASGVLNSAVQVGTALGLAVSVPLGFRGGWVAAGAIALAAAAATRWCRPSRRRPTMPRR